MAADYFLQIDGILGESQDAQFKNAIEVTSWNFGAAQPSGSGGSRTSAGAGAGKVSVEDITFTMNTSKASPLLFTACATGQHLKTMTLSVRKAGGKAQVYIIVTLTACLVTSFHTIGGSTDGTNANVVPVDEITVNFGQVNYQYSPQNADGTMGSPIKTGYNLTTNTKL